MAGGMRYISRNDREYPSVLTRYERMPEGIYVIGDLPDGDKKSVAIVGARACSDYGRAEAQRFAGELAACGVQIISGMALGIDSAAHEGALAAGGRTFAVLGCGADVCYPYSKAFLYRKIIQNGGIISELEPGTPALAYHFPIRNRIISALSDAVIVIEARKKSGSLITANYALEQNKTIYAMPGRIRDSLSEGTNDLICQGAVPAVSPEQILNDLGIRKAGAYNKKEGKQNRKSLNTEGLSDEENLIVSGIVSDPKSLEMLHTETGIEIGKLYTLITGLIMKDIIYETITGRYLLK